MKILAIIDLAPGTTPDQIAPFLKAEAARAWELHKAGIFRDMNFCTDRPRVVNTLECTCLEEAAEAVNSLPLTKAGYFTYQLMPLGYPSFLENLWVAHESGGRAGE